MQVMRKLFFAHLHQAIRSEFEGMLREPLPQRCLDLIQELERQAARDGVGPDRSSDKLPAEDGVEQQ